MKSGAAPTDLKARTGLSTPPGRIRVARLKRERERLIFIGMIVDHEQRSIRRTQRKQRTQRLSAANRRVLEFLLWRLTRSLVRRAEKGCIQNARGRRDRPA